MMINELEGIWKEEVMASLRYYTCICIGDSGKLQKETQLR
jgi:hypothetical protein